MRSPPRYPIGPAVSPLVVSLTLERASALLDAAQRLGRHHDMLPLTVVVFDSGGHMIALKSEDGSGIFRVQVANAKAYGALGMGVSTRVMDQRLADRPVFAGSLSVVSDGQFVPVPGGVLIRAADGSRVGRFALVAGTAQDSTRRLKTRRALKYKKPRDPIDPAAR